MKKEEKAALKPDAQKYWRSFYRITNILERYFKGRLNADEEREVEKNLDILTNKVLEQGKENITEAHLNRADRLIRKNVFNRLGLPLSPLPGKRKTAVFSLRFPQWAAAAAVLFLIGFSYWGLRPESAFRQQYLAWSVEPGLLLQTGSSERKSIRLPDQSLVYLNGDSRLSYKAATFNKSRRELWLEGEAFFEVAKNPGKPFIIHSPGGVQTTVIGTSFNLKAYSGLNEQVVSVCTGKVLVATGDGATLRITPDRKAVFNRQVNSLTEGMTNGEQAASWRNGQIVFDGAGREEIALRIRQQFGKEVIIQNDALAGAHFIASYPPDTPLEAIVKAIALAGETQYAIGKNKIIFR